MNRSAHCSSVAPRSSEPSLRHEARTTSPSSAPTTAGRPRSSASLAATRPTIPTLHGPRTMVAAPTGASPTAARASATAVFIRSRRVRLAASSASAWLPASTASVGEQQPRGLERLPHPSGRIEPRGDGERHRLEVHRGGVDPGPLEEGRDPGTRRAAQPFQPEPRDRPVLADDRRDVGDGPDRRQVGEVERGGRTARLVGEQQLGDLEGHAAPGQSSVRVGRVRPVRVDDGERRRA